MPESKTWTWVRQGVTLEADHLLWFEDVGATSYASGAACEQTLADFAANGPGVLGVPADVVEALTIAIAIAARA